MVASPLPSFLWDLYGQEDGAALAVDQYRHRFARGQRADQFHKVLAILDLLIIYLEDYIPFADPGFFGCSIAYLDDCDPLFPDLQLFPLLLREILDLDIQTSLSRCIPRFCGSQL